MKPGEQRGYAAKQELLERFAPETDPFVEIGIALGAEALDKVLDILGGVQVRPPTRENFWLALERDLRNERIRAEFDGANHAELAERYGLKSVRQVRNILAEPKSEAKKATGKPVSVKGTRL